jgi:hypothetical protein
MLVFYERVKGKFIFFMPLLGKALNGMSAAGKDVPMTKPKTTFKNQPLSASERNTLRVMGRTGAVIVRIDIEKGAYKIHRLNDTEIAKGISIVSLQGLEAKNYVKKEIEASPKIDDAPYWTFTISPKGRKLLILI